MSRPKHGTVEYHYAHDLYGALQRGYPQQPEKRASNPLMRPRAG